MDRQSQTICMVRIMYIFILPCFIIHYFLVTFQRETCESSEHFCYQMIHGEGAQRTEIRECWDLAYEVRGIKGQRSGIWSMRKGGVRARDQGLLGPGIIGEGE